MIITKRKFFIVWLLGFMSGFTLMISGNTLNFWLAKENIDLQTIGVFALISIPYAINFTWAPIFDTVKLPILNKLFGKRLSWLLLIQILLSSAIYVMSTLSPTYALELLAICGFVIAFLASAQDTILGAMRTEMVDKNRQGEIAGMYVFGYRIGMLASSSGAIYISQYVHWGLVYELFSVITIAFPLILLLFTNDLLPIKQEFTPKVEDPNTKPALQKSALHRKMIDFFSEILKPVGKPKYIIFVLIFLALYRLPDNFISMMINPFLLHIGYDEFEISTAGKLFGTSAAMIGGFLASYIMKKKNLYDSLLIFGSVHAIAHLFFVLQELYGKNLYMLFVVIGFEGVSGGMSMAAYIAFIASLCQGKFRATQYSFFSSMMGFSRSIFPALSGYIVSSFGWTVFYLFTTIATLPSLMMILYLEKLQKQNSSEEK